MITEGNIREIYDITGLTPLAGGYEFTFPYTSAQDVRVYTTGNRIDTEVSTSNYTIDRSGATPKVVFTTGYSFPAGQTKLTIIRNVSYSQELDLRNGDLIDADKLEGALDDITQQIQQVAEKVDRAILSSVSDIEPLSIPEASQRNNMLLGFDNEGKAIPVLTTDIEQKLAQALAAEESAITAKNAAENAQHEAESAQSAAETAQEMAETAQAAAESAEASSQALLASISTKTEESIASINTTKTGAVGAVTTQQATSVAAVQAAQNTAESDIAGKRASALTAIDTAKTAAVAAVNTQKETSVAAADREIVAKRDSALTDIQTARTNAVNAITSQKDTSLQEIEQLTSERKAEINSLAANQKADVKQYTDGVVASAKTDIDTEKTKAVTAVQEEGDAEVTRVQSVYQTDLNELKGDLGVERARFDDKFKADSINIINPLTCVMGQLSSNGVVIDSKTQITTDYIVVVPGEQLLASYTNASGNRAAVTFARICVYDSDKKYIRMIASNTTYTVEADVSYCRISFVSSINEFMVEKGTTISNKYVPYSEKMDGENIKDKSIPITKLAFQVRENKLLGKTLVCFGDSIFGNYNPPTDIPSYIAELTGMKVYNQGYGGTRAISHSADFDPFCFYRLVDAVTTGDYSAQDLKVNSTVPSYYANRLTELKGIDFNTVDFVTFNYGTNDWGTGYPLDNGGLENPYASFGVAIRYAIDTLLTAYPHLRIMPLTPIWRARKIGNDGLESDANPNSVGIYLWQYAEKTQAVAKEYHLPCLDLYYTTGINKKNHALYLEDGLHPNNKGRILLANKIAEKLNVEYC